MGGTHVYTIGWVGTNTSNLYLNSYKATFKYLYIKFMNQKLSYGPFKRILSVRKIILIVRKIDVLLQLLLRKVKPVSSTLVLSRFTFTKIEPFSREYIPNLHRKLFFFCSRILKKGKQYLWCI